MRRRASRRTLLRGGAAASLAGLAAACSGDADPVSPTTSTPSPDPPGTAAAPTPTTDASPTADGAPRPRVAGTVVEGLAVPWGIVFLPDGSALVGERDTGRLLRVRRGKAEEVGRLEVRGGGAGGGETGLLGLALYPGSGDTPLLYAYLSTDEDNRIVRMSYDGRRLGAPSPVLTGIGTSTHHNGGGLAFGPDGMLYAATGDAEDPASAQDPDSLDGKILRLTDAGTVPRDNPFGNHTWSYGHRNVEGITFDAQGRLWAAEFGDKGADELNLIEAGRDYGWPDVEGSDGRGGYADPLAQWPVDQCSPSGVAVTAGRAWLAALRGQCLWSVVLDGPDAGRTEQHLTGEYGRLRSVALAPDGSLWVTTSNRDGRADPGPRDDRILRVIL